jgi:hypothetical protein
MGVDIDLLSKGSVMETKSYLVQPIVKKVMYVKHYCLVSHYQILRKGESEQVEVTCTLWNQLVDKFYSSKTPSITCVDINSLWSHANGDIPDVPGYVFSFLKNALESGELKHLYLPSGAITFKSRIDNQVVTQGNSRLDILDNNPVALMAQTCPALSPESDVNVVVNEAAQDKAVQERILDVRNETEPPDKYTHYLLEFRGLLLARKTGIPMDPSDVLERQNKPMQKVRNERAKQHTVKKSKASYFLKADPTQKKLDESNNTLSAAPVRLITQYTPEQCLALSRYTYAFKDEILANTHWYAPGWTPTTTNEKVQRYITNFPRHQLLETDFSKMDGRISKFLRSIERTVYLAYFESTQSELLKLLDNDYGSTVSNKNKSLKYEGRYERGSGSALTTDGNTLICAFISYCHHRNRGHNPRVSWQMLGPKAGDDSLDYGPLESYKETCKDLGMEVTGFNVPRNGKQVVTFLSRTYKGSAGGMSSICDVGRAIRKLHLSSNKIKSNEANFANKVFGYGVTDPNTPIIKNLVALVKRILPNQLEPTNYDALSYQARQGPYPNMLCEEEMVALVSKQMGITPESVAVVMQKVDDARSLDDLKLIVPTRLKTIPRDRDLFNSSRKLTAVSSRRKTNTKIDKRPIDKTTTTIDTLPRQDLRRSRNGKQEKKPRSKNQAKENIKHDGSPSSSEPTLNPTVCINNDGQTGGQC